jgi:hypothetical protein
METCARSEEVSIQDQEREREEGTKKKGLGALGSSI